VAARYSGPVLIILPSSETKAAAPARGRPVALEALSFPELGQFRAQVLDALIETSAGPDALQRLRVGPSLAEEVARNTALRDLAARPVLEVYAGTVHQGLGWATVPVGARRRAARRVVVASSLWGLLRPSDRIPPYRLDVCAHLVGIDKLEPAWRTVLPDALAEAAGARGVIVDLRSGSYQALGRVPGGADRTVTVMADKPEGGRAGSVIAKRTRGQVARYLLESGGDPASLSKLVEVVAQRWPVRLEPPDRPGLPWEMTLTVAS
jgi:cytoplasmic iron level regulating protein YaaA (DUF328/UPF0246 family)